MLELSYILGIVIFGVSTGLRNLVKLREKNNSSPRKSNNGLIEATVNGLV